MTQMANYQVRIQGQVLRPNLKREDAVYWRDRAASLLGEKSQLPGHRKDVVILANNWSTPRDKMPLGV